MSKADHGVPELDVIARIEEELCKLAALHLDRCSGFGSPEAVRMGAMNAGLRIAGVAAGMMRANGALLNEAEWLVANGDREVFQRRAASTKTEQAA